MRVGISRFLYLTAMTPFCCDAREMILTQMERQEEETNTGRTVNPLMTGALQVSLSL